jgi:hypothetical protein
MRRNIAEFIEAWLNGYLHPAKTFESLRSRSSPLWGFLGVLICWIARDLLIIIPQFLMGHEPITESWLTILTTERYYSVWVFFVPVFGMVKWLLAGSLIYLLLRLAKGVKDFDTILNYTGFIALIITPLGIVMDWIIVLVGQRSLLILAITHTGVLVVWSICLSLYALKKLFDLKLPIRITAVLITLPFDIFLGALFSR